MCLLYSEPMDVCTVSSLPRSGLLASPDYPSGYNKAHDCSITVKAPLQTDVIKLRLYDIDMDKRTTKGCYDHLYLNEEGNLAKYFDTCGTLNDLAEEPDNEYIGELNIQFKTDKHDARNAGFLLYYEGTVTECTVFGAETFTSMIP